MKTKIKRENSQINVYYAGEYVASIFKNARPDIPYGLAYRDGRYEVYQTYGEARAQALKIMCKKDILDRVILY